MKSETVFVCDDCGKQLMKWMGRCPVCGAWNTVVEKRSAPTARPRTGGPYADENQAGVDWLVMPPEAGWPEPASGIDNLITPLVEEFIGSVRGDGPPLRTMYDARAIVAVLEAAYRSLASGQVEAVAVAPRPTPATA